MKSITIHGIDQNLGTKISELSAELGLSQNKTIKHVLSNSLLSDKKEERKKSFSEFLGLWTEKEANEFEKRIEDLETVDENEWKPT